MIQLPRYDSYKDSGVQWLGEIPSHWAVKKLKFLTSYFKGFAFKSEDFSDIGIPLIKASNVKKFSIENVESHIAFEKVQDAFDRVKLQEGDLILSTVGSLPNVLNSAVGQIAYVSQDFAGSYLNQNNVCFRSNGKVLPIFLKYFVMSSFFRRNLDVKALWIANQAYLEVLDVQNISIIFPDLEEQKIIADFLDKRLAQVDALIAKQEALLEKLAEQRVALISHAVTKGLNPDVELKDSGDVFFGKIPKHWKVIALHFIVRLISGDSITALDFVADGDYPVYGGNGFRGYIDRYTHQGNYVLIGRQGALCGNINFASGYFFATEHAVVVNPLIHLNYKWLGFLLMAMNLNQYSTTAAQPGISAEVIGRLKILLPEIEEQNQIADFIETELRDIEELENKAIVLKDKLKEYRSTLITQVVTGKIDVRKHQIN